MLKKNPQSNCQNVFVGYFSNASPPVSHLVLPWRSEWRNAAATSGERTEVNMATRWHRCRWSADLEKSSLSVDMLYVYIYIHIRAYVWIVYANIEKGFIHTCIYGIMYVYIDVYVYVYVYVYIYTFHMYPLRLCVSRYQWKLPPPHAVDKHKSYYIHIHTYTIVYCIPRCTSLQILHEVASFIVFYTSILMSSIWTNISTLHDTPNKAGLEGRHEDRISSLYNIHAISRYHVLCSVPW